MTSMKNDERKQQEQHHRHHHHHKIYNLWIHRMKFCQICILLVTIILISPFKKTSFVVLKNLINRLVERTYPPPKFQSVAIERFMVWILASLNVHTRCDALLHAGTTSLIISACADICTNSDGYFVQNINLFLFHITWDNHITYSTKFQ